MLVMIRDVYQENSREIMQKRGSVIVDKMLIRVMENRFNSKDFIKCGNEQRHS